MKVSELLTSLNINHVPLKLKEDIDIPDLDHLWVSMGSSLTLVYHTDKSIDGVMIPWVTVGFDSYTMWKIKERTLLDQLDWYNKLKGELTIACKARTNINELSISLLQLELVCNYYKGEMMRTLLSLVLLFSLVSCGCDAPNTKVDAQFKIDQSDQWPHCPKCNGIPAYMIYHTVDHNSADCYGTVENVGNEEHFKVQCRACGFMGYMTIQDGKIARMAHP